MKTPAILLLSALLVLEAAPALAHFGLVLPSEDIVGTPGKAVTFELAFLHPHRKEYMDLERPQEIKVLGPQGSEDLLPALREERCRGKRCWSLRYTPRRPGDHIFYMVPRPYWEETEGRYIQHMTKVVVNAFGLEEGWDRPVGLQAEILPLTRPYGLFTGNTFCGIALFGGRPAKNARVEIERLGLEPALPVPSPPFETQVLKTDDEGRFCYGIPAPGWWGIAVLKEEKGALKKDGRPADLELGAVIWIRAVSPEAR